MKITFLLFLSLISASVLFGQGNVGIGTSSPSNKLHVVNTSDPLRLEGVSTGATTDSILTINSTGVVKRRTLASVQGTAGWSLTGNSGLSATTNFIGTTTLIPFVVRTNNLRSAYIDADSTKRNNSFGNRSITAITTGTGNNAFGYQALGRITTGNNNTILGDSAAFSITTGSDNVALGADAGALLTVGTQNVAIGTRSLASAVAGSNNIAIGHLALEKNIAAANVAIGTGALDNNTTGSDNIAIGINSLGTNTIASTNVAVGNDALAAITTGAENLGLGYRPLFALTTGTQNTALGHFALSSNLTGNYSTMVGYHAGANFTGGSNNTFVGYNADATPVTVNNSSALGSGATVTQSNMVRIGGTGITLIGGAVGFSTISDERVKTNVRSNVPGLDFISLLKPVTYNYNLKSIDDIQGVKPEARIPNAAKEKIRYSGFLAQDVLKAAEQTGYDFSGVNKPDNEKSLYSINYSELVVPLVKAVQDLKAIIEKQQAEINELKKTIGTK